jgi:Uma2 family endonuclease
MISMPSVATSSRPFEPGTTGWTADDLEDPEIEAQWASGNYEIVEGVLTRIPPAYFTGGRSLNKLVRIVEDYLERERIVGEFATEVEIIIEKSRVPRADAAMLTAEDKARQVRAVKALAKRDPDRTRILVPPTPIIESVSPGHELHDEQTKKRWYAEFGVPNYWLLHALRRSLHCYRLEGGEYLLDASGRDREEVRP